VLELMMGVEGLIDGGDGGVDTGYKVSGEAFL